MERDISVVVFDFGNVLAKVDRLKICSHLAVHSPFNAEEICKRIYGTDIEYDSETGRYDSREHFRRIKERIDGEKNWTYEEFRDEFKDGFERNKDGEKALIYASKYARVFVLSNTTYLHSLYLFEQEILATIPELFVFSYKVGVMKPDKRIWERMCEMGRVKPEDCLYIDDVKEYCDVASNLGFSVIHYNFREMKLVDELKKWLG